MEDLAMAFFNAKAAEIVAKNLRLTAEKELLASLVCEKLEGVETFVTPKFKIKVTNKLTKKLDYDKYLALGLDDNTQFVDLKPSINIKRLLAMELFSPETVAACITTKPAKPSIKLEAV